MSAVFLDEQTTFAFHGCIFRCIAKGVECGECTKGVIASSIDPIYLSGKIAFSENNECFTNMFRNL